MNRTIKTIIVAIIVFILSGCATTYHIGEEFDISNLGNIELGITTQQEIIDHFGKPLKRGISNGDVIYYYADEEIIIENNNEVKRNGNTLVVEFNKNGTVKNYYYNVPGNETPLFGYLIHKKKTDTENQVAQQNQVGTYSAINQN